MVLLKGIQQRGSNTFTNVTAYKDKKSRGFRLWTFPFLCCFRQVICPISMAVPGPWLRSTWAPFLVPGPRLRATWAPFSVPEPLVESHLGTFFGARTLPGKHLGTLFGARPTPEKHPGTVKHSFGCLAWYMAPLDTEKGVLALPPEKKTPSQVSFLFLRPR